VLYMIAAVLALIWLLGQVTYHTLGGFVHVLLLIAMVLVVVSIVGRPAIA
jgi:hypothetical protein